MPNSSARVPGPGNPNADLNHYDLPSCAEVIQPTLPEKFRTINIRNESDHGDWTFAHPWRAPGHAPVADPCGVAGAYHEKPGGGVGGATPYGAKRGDLGSQLKPLAGVHTEWRRDEGTAEVAFMLGANHGGAFHVSKCTYDLSCTYEWSFLVSAKPKRVKSASHQLNNSTRVTHTNNSRVPHTNNSTTRVAPTIRFTGGYVYSILILLLCPHTLLGGYVYSVCPSASPITEACFSAHTVSGLQVQPV
jgi:hypothetical protein